MPFHLAVGYVKNGTGDPHVDLRGALRQKKTPRFPQWRFFDEKAFPFSSAIRHNPWRRHETATRWGLVEKGTDVSCISQSVTSGFPFSVSLSH